MAFLTTKLAVRIALGLPGLVITVLDVLIGVVLFDPGQDVLGIQGDDLAQVGAGG